MDYLKIKKTAEKSTATDDDIREFSEEIMETWWKKNKDNLLGINMNNDKLIRAYTGNGNKFYLQKGVLNKVTMILNKHFKSNKAYSLLFSI